MSFCSLSSIQYAFKEVNFPKLEQKSEAFTLINPFQEFPAIVHQGFNLWESGAILTYLSEVFDTDNQWYPKDLKIRGRVNAFLHWHHQNLRIPIIQYYREKSTFPYFYGRPDLSPEKEEIFRVGLDECLKNFEWILSFTGFAAQTQNMTIADVFAFNEIFNGQMAFIELDEYPRLKDWYLKVRSVEEVEVFLPAAQSWIDRVIKRET
jgi:glutathione S-transferase